MRAMKDSGQEWLGAIPTDWEVDRIGTFFEQRAEKVSDEDYPPLSVTKQGVLPQLDHVAKSDDHANRKLVRKGDFAINSRSDRRNSCGFSPMDGSVSLINTVCEPRGMMVSKYFGHLFDTSQFADEYYAYGHGIVADLWTTGWKDMKKILIPVPPIDEQQRIADYLDDKCAEIDKAIEAAEASMQDYVTFKKAAVSKVIENGLRGEELVECWSPWISRIPKSWSVQPLSRLSRYISDGVHQTPTYVMVGEPFLSIKDISSGKICFDDCKMIPYEEHLKLSKTTPVEDGDVLFTRIGTLGVAVVVRDCPSFDIFVSIGIVKPDNSLIVSEFLAYVMQSDYYYRFIQTVKAGGETSAAKFNLGDVRRSHIVLPAIDEQYEIVEYLDKYCEELDAAIAAKQSIIDDLKAYKQSLVYEVVTGKREV